MYGKPRSTKSANPIKIKRESKSTISSDCMSASMEPVPDIINYEPLCLHDKLMFVSSILCYLRMTSYLLSNGKLTKMRRTLQSELQLLSRFKFNAFLDHAPYHWKIGYILINFTFFLPDVYFILQEIRVSWIHITPTFPMHMFLSQIYRWRWWSLDLFPIWSASLLYTMQMLVFICSQIRY